MTEPPRLWAGLLFLLRRLAFIAGVLTLSMLVTGGPALYLTLVPEARADLVPPPASPAARIAYVSDREGDTAIYTLASGRLGQRAKQRIEG